MGILELLEGLEERQLDYVIERSKVHTDKEGFENAEIGKSTFYKWTQEERDELNALALRLKRENAVLAELVFQGYLEQAAKNVVKIADKGRSESVKLKANEVVLERGMGKVSQKVEQEVSGKNGGKIVVRLVSDD